MPEEVILREGALKLLAHILMCIALCHFYPETACFYGSPTDKVLGDIEDGAILKGTEALRNVCHIANGALRPVEFIG